MVRRCCRRGDRTSPYYYGCALNRVKVQQTLAIYIRAAVPRLLGLTNDAQSGKRTERIQRWLSGSNCLTAICTRAPTMRCSRSASGKLPTDQSGR